MRRGTRVGEAYVALAVDGDGINKDIVDSVDDAGPGVEKAGKEHGEAYGENFDEGFFSRIRGKIRKGLDKDLGDAGEDAGDSVGKRLEKSLGRAGDKIGATLGERIADSLEDKLEMSLANMIDTLDVVSKSGGGRSGGGGDGTNLAPPPIEQRRLEAAYRMDKAFERARTRVLAAAYRMNEEFNKKQYIQLQSAYKMNEAFDKKRGLMIDSAYRQNEAHDRKRGILIDTAYRMEEAFNRRRISLQEKAFASYAKNLPDANGKRGGVSGNSGGKSPSDRIGSIFGAGSRNNALNSTGRLVGGISGLIFKATGAATNMFKVFQKGFTEAAAGATGVQKVIAGLGGVVTSAGGGLAKGFSSLAASGPAAIVAIVAVGAALTIVVSIASALLAIVVALAATIASALAGAALVGAGAFAALGAAAGLAVMAFRSMTDAQKAAMKEAFEPLHQIVTGLGQTMLRDMIPAFAKWSDNLQIALTLIKPLADVMGGAFARAGIILTNALSGKGIQLFIDALGETLPRIVTNLSNAFGKFLNGVSSVFAALMPSVLRFSDYLSKAATDFAKWASSAKGQSSIKDFVDRAIDSLKSLWGFIKETGSLIADFLFSKEGQEAGNSIFDDMKKGLRDFADYVGKEGRLEQWFKDGKKFAKQLGDAIDTVAKILEDLNNSKVIDGIGGLVSIAEKAYSAWDAMPDAITGIINPLNMLLTPIQALSGAIDVLLGKQQQASNWTPPQFRPGNSGGNPLVPGGSTSDSVPPNPLIPGGAVDGRQFESGYGVSRNSRRGDPDRSVTDDLIKMGEKALSETSEANGGHMAEAVAKAAKGAGKKAKEKLEIAKKEWKNPYLDFANSILADAPLLANELKASAKAARDELRAAFDAAMDALSDAIREAGNETVATILDAAKPLGIAIDAAYDKLFSAGDPTSTAGSSAVAAGKAVTEAFNAQITSLRDTMGAGIENAQTAAKDLVANAKAARADMVASAEAAVQSAAQALAGASGPKEAKAAKEALKQAQKDLADAKNKGNLLVNEAEQSAQKLIDRAEGVGDAMNRATAILAAQGVLTVQNALDLSNGLKVQGATLADYAAARVAVADKLQAANQKLAEAISLRDNYNNSVADSVRSFGSLITAQAKTIDGVTQALTATDITDNLRERLGKVKAFQENLRILLANGLSDAAYKQLVDAGVETGGAYAAAILEGGSSAVGEVNDLTAQIGAAGEALGGAASSQLYQAGVDAAQGLVDGLMSLSAELDSAAAELGEAIAEAVKRALGIASPSKVMRGMMTFVGDGAVIGLDDQRKKVSDAATRFSDQIAISPEVAAYAAQQEVIASQGGAQVSGNSGDRRFRDLIIQTPTEDPKAVAREVLNEVVEVL